MIVVLFAVLLASSLHLPSLDAQASPAVLGTDRNGDGVRDEVERYILKTYPNDTQADLRAALLEVVLRLCYGRPKLSLPKCLSMSKLI